MLLLSSICNKDVLSANKVAAEEIPQWVPLKQKVVKDVCRLNSSTPTSTASTQLSLVRLKTRLHDPFLRIRFLVPKTGSRHSDGQISRFHFCGENVGR